MQEQEDPDLQLAPDTLSILQEFLREKEEREKLEQRLEGTGNFEENWQLSQFWYTEATKQTLATACKNLTEKELQQTTDNTDIALLSCPSLYSTFKSIFPKVKLFEYDKRFAAHGDDFIFYDYNEADVVSEKYSECCGGFDIIILDPPFLSDECMAKISKFVKYFSKTDTKTILCSGLVVKEWAEKYMGLKLCKFEPQHERNLGNEFVSFANFDMDEYIN